MEFFNMCSGCSEDSGRCSGCRSGRVGCCQPHGGYGGDNPSAKSQGMKQLMAGGGVALIGITLIPLLSGLFG